MPILSTRGAASYRGFVTQSYGFSATVLLVAGGGGTPGGYEAGGAGAGGVIYNTNTNLVSGIAYTVTIGGGGTAGAGGNPPSSGSNGFNTTLSTLTALGGGTGGSFYITVTNSSGTSYGMGANGGSGGGAARNFNISGASGGTATQPSSSSGGYGNNGGNQPVNATDAAGGGGAGGIGTNPSSDGNTGGNGGIGIYNSLTNSTQTGQLSSGNYYLGGGGGGCGSTTGGTGGLGGGGAGTSGTSATNGTANTGGGGGGQRQVATGTTGGSGIALISSPYVAAVSSLTGSPTIIGLPSFTNYSGSFNGTNQYLTVGAASNWTFLNNGSTNFTVECWFNVASTSLSNSYTILSTSTSTANIGFSLELNDYSSGDVTVVINKGTSGTPALIIKDLVGNKFSANTWNHLAVVFNSSTSVCTVYMNGTSILSATGSGFSSSTPSYILAMGRYQAATPGGYINGYISNLRITNTAVYTSAFTPSTVPLTAITGTQLLTLQNATITDTSTNAFTITNNGSVTTSSTVQPFPQAPITSYVYKFTSSGSLPYTTNTFLNYAASFNGTNQYLTVATGQGINNFGAGNFTVELWIYFTVVQAGQIVSAGDGSNTNAYYWQYYGGQLQFGNQNVGSITAYNWTPTTNTWYHVAVVRSGTTVTQYINGTSVSSATSNITFVDGATYIAFGGAGYFNGRISNVRIIKGTALYTSNFTPSTTHLTAVSGTQLLTCQNAALVDNSTNNFTITNNNTVTTTYTTVPFNY